MGCDMCLQGHRDTLLHVPPPQSTLGKCLPLANCKEARGTLLGFREVVKSLNSQIRCSMIEFLSSGPDIYAEISITHGGDLF